MRVGWKRAGLALPAFLLLTRPGDASPRPEVIVDTQDVGAFYRVYDAANGRPTSADLQREYLDAGSDALHGFAADREITGERLADAISKKPSTFSKARRCAQALPEIEVRLKVVLGRLQRIYPKAIFPPVTIVIGRGATGGTTNARGVIIGLETLCSADFMNPDLGDRFVHLIAHEYVHVQQPAARSEPDHPTVLFASLIEGGAELVGALISGDVGNYQLKRWTVGHEAAIEEAFAADEGSTDLKPWLWSGLGTPEKPGDLGYWVGTRIARCYYDAAKDKRRAVADIIGLRSSDAVSFLARSGWRPGRPCASAHRGEARARRASPLPVRTS